MWCISAGLESKTSYVLVTVNLYFERKARSLFGFSGTVVFKQEHPLLKRLKALSSILLQAQL